MADSKNFYIRLVTSHQYFNMQTATVASPEYKFLDPPWLSTQAPIELGIPNCDVVNHDRVKPSIFINQVFCDLSSPIRVWMVGRFLDWNNSGHVATTYLEIASLLNVTVPSARRLVKEAKKLGYVRIAEKERRSQTLQLYTSSGRAICEKHHITQAGVSFELTIEELQLQTMRCKAAEAEAVRLQRQSVKAAKKAAKIRHLETSDLIAAASNKCRGVPSSQSKLPRFTRISHNSPSMGGSQRTIAKRIGRSERTIQRRLSNQRRQRLGLPHLDRTQILKAVDVSLDPQQLAFLSQLQNQFSVTWDAKSNRSIKITFRRFAECPDFSAWIYCPNIYDSDLFVKPDRRLSKQLKGLNNQPPQSN